MNDTFELGDLPGVDLECESCGHAIPYSDEQYMQYCPVCPWSWRDALELMVQRVAEKVDYYNALIPEETHAALQRIEVRKRHRQTLADIYEGRMNFKRLAGVPADSVIVGPEAAKALRAAPGFTEKDGKFTMNHSALIDVDVSVPAWWHKAKDEQWVHEHALDAPHCRCITSLPEQARRGLLSG